MEESISRSSDHTPALRDSSLPNRVMAEEGPVSIIQPDLRMGGATMLRDFLTVIFRHSKLILLSFSFIFAGVILLTFSMPRQYESDMKILVKRERVDLVVAPDATSQMINMPDVTQEDLNSEVELLKSSDLLQKVVVATGLHKTQKKPSLIDRAISRGERISTESNAQIPRAVMELSKNLTIEPVSKSHLIDVRYKTTDPQRSARVLEALAGIYLEKHLSVHRPPGAFDFFRQQTEQYRKELETAERQLGDFAKKEGVLSVDLEKDITLRTLNSFESQLQEAKASEAAIGRRIKSLQAQIAATPARVTTQVKTSSNAPLLQQLSTTMLNLELKRTELLTKFEPGYRLVQEVDAQIVQTKEAITKAESGSLSDQTTDLDKTRLWLDEELAKTQAERATLQARIASLENSVEAYKRNAQQIGRKGMEYQDLSRAAKGAEENYLLYLRKQEEARISDALDRKRIVNATIAEAPTVPAFPSGPSRALFLVLGLVLAPVAGIGVAFVADYLDPSFRTPDEVESLLDVPVVACLPRN